MLWTPAVVEQDGGTFLRSSSFDKSSRILSFSVLIFLFQVFFFLIVMSITPEIRKEIERVLNEKIKPLLKEINELRQKVDEVNEFAQFSNKKYEETVQLLERQKSINHELINENKILKSTIQEIEKKITNQSNKLNDLEQYGRRDCVEINGIPASRDENTNNIVMKVGELIGVQVDEDDISISHRLPVSSNYKGDRSNPSIIVKFVRRDLKEEFYSSRKDLKNFSTEDLGYSTTNNIYVNESLTEKNKELFRESLKAKKSLNYKFIWTSNGRIYLRKDSNSRIIHIKDKNTIKELLHR